MPLQAATQRLANRVRMPSHALTDLALCLPKCWADERVRFRVTHLRDEVALALKLYGVDAGRFGSRVLCILPPSASRRIRLIITGLSPG